MMLVIMSGPAVLAVLILRKSFSTLFVVITIGSYIKRWYSSWCQVVAGHHHV